MIDSHIGGRNTCTLSHSMVLLRGLKVPAIKDQQTYLPATEQVQIHFLFIKTELNTFPPSLRSNIVRKS